MSTRNLRAELLDALPASDSRAVGSRADLRRLNFLMGHVGIFDRAFRSHFEATQVRSRPLRLVELGAGDGTLLLRLAREWSRRGIVAEVTFVDRQSLVSAETRQAFAALGWTTQSMVDDVFGWLESPASASDLIMANLFLHHFSNQKLAVLLQLAAAKTQCFIACEPCRSPLSALAARLLWLIGCNVVTRHDALISVQAGFIERDLSELWPRDNSWQTTERTAGLFSHLFSAKRRG